MSPTRQPARAELEERVTRWLAQQDVPIYLVGGCVRDRLLARQTYDLDLAVDGDGLNLARQLANRFGGAFYALDRERSTGRAILAAGEAEPLVVDIARFRGPDLRADLADRDFTLNALAADIRDPSTVIDHHGGIGDLEARLIRPVSRNSIRNDPLRALRAIRQAAELDFTLGQETKALIRRDGSGLASVSCERTRDELARLLDLAGAAPYLVLADDLGLLTTILPELEPLRGLAQPPPHHLDALTHTLETLRALEGILDTWLQDGPRHAAAASHSFDPPLPEALSRLALRLQAHVDQRLGASRRRLLTLKLAALLHDSGKPAARSVDENGRIRFLGHAKESLRITGRVLRRLRLNNTEVRLGETIVRHHMRPLLLAGQEGVSSRAVYRFFRDTGEAGVEVLLHALADHRATYAPDTPGDPWPRLADLVARMLTDYWERPAQQVQPPRLLDGKDLLCEFGQEFALSPGPRVGELLEAVREAQVTGHVHTREQALELVRARLAGGS
jgi:tRNA nucleotidyltransferase/poly(A) polymerase